MTFQEATADFINLYRIFPNDLLYKKYIDPIIGGEEDLDQDLRQIGIDTYIAKRGRNTVRSLFVVYTFFAALAFMIIVTGGLIKYFIIYCKGCE